MNTITESQANDIREREAKLTAWRGKRNSYDPKELPPDINPPSNNERSELEIFDFCHDKPDRYFLYINDKQSVATTWTGDILGTCRFGKSWRDNMGATRVSVRIEAINGYIYSGTYYKSAGSYARVKKVKA